MYKKFSGDDNICLQQPEADSQVDIINKTVKWEELAPLPVGHSAHTAVLLGGNVYVGGGFEGRGVDDFQDSYRLDVYNLTTNHWSPSPITTPYRYFAMTVLDDSLVTVGGKTKNDEVVKKILVLDIGQWKDYSEMPTARFSPTAVGYHSMLIVVGGGSKIEDTWTVLSTAELLDTTNGCWYTCNNLPSPRRQMKAAIMNDTLYLLNGFDNNSERPSHVFIASLDTLSTRQLNWQSAPNTPWCCSVPVVLYDKFLLAVGGRAPSDYTLSNEVYTLNVSVGQWRHLTKIPAARSNSTAVSINNKMVIIGGMTNNNFSNTVWIGIFK